MLDEVVDVIGERQLEVADRLLAVAPTQLVLAQIEVGFAQALGELPVILHPFDHIAHQLGGIHLAGVETNQIPVPGIVIVLVETLAHPAHGRCRIEFLLGQIEPDHPIRVFRLRLVEALHIGGCQLRAIAVVERDATVQVGIVVIGRQFERRIECLVGFVIILLLHQIDTDEVVGFGEIGLLPQGTVEIEPRKGAQTNAIKDHCTLIEQLGTLLRGQLHLAEHLPESS